MNKAEVTGYVKWAPRTFSTQKDGTPGAAAVIALDDDPREHPTQIEVNAFGPLANIIGSFNEGDMVSATGELFEGRWKDKNTGEWKSKMSIRCSQVELVEAADPVMASVGDTFDDIPF